MAFPIIMLLQLMSRLRWLMVIGFFVILAHIWYNDALRAWDSWHQPPEPQLFCDDAHKIPFVPADKCGGMTSCDRWFNRNLGVPIACPK